MSDREWQLGHFKAHRASARAQLFGGHSPALCGCSELWGVRGVGEAAEVLAWEESPSIDPKSLQLSRAMGMSKAAELGPNPVLGDNHSPEYQAVCGTSCLHDCLQCCFI